MGCCLFHGVHLTKIRFFLGARIYKPTEVAKRCLGSKRAAAAGEPTFNKKLKGSSAEPQADAASEYWPEEDGRDWSQKEAADLKEEADLREKQSEHWSMDGGTKAWGSWSQEAADHRASPHVSKEEHSWSKEGWQEEAADHRASRQMFFCDRCFLPMQLTFLESVIFSLQKTYSYSML